MALRTSSRVFRFAPPSHRIPYRRYASTATASSLPEGIQRDIEHEASLPNPDPSPDSASAAFLREKAPHMIPTYVRPPPVMVRGDGCYLWDMENRPYLDFTAGIAVNSLGHNDERINQVISDQCQTLIHASNLYHNAWTPTLSELLISETRKQSPDSPLSEVFICNSGSEANEAAIKFARKVTYAKSPTTTQREIVSFHDSFHGRTLGSLSATPNTKYQAPFGPMLPGFRYGVFNDTAALDTLITSDTCAVIVEPIQGEGGINVATPEFLHALRARCDAVSALLIFDEIQCGLSRTGDLWAHTAAAVHPDILTTAKALGNGIPIGATLISGTSVAPYIKTGDHGTTFGGNPFACRVAHHVFGRLASPTLQAAVRAKSARFHAAYTRLAAEYPDVFTECRGRGLILGWQLSESAKGRAGAVVTAARERGLLVITAGDGVLRLVPPLVLSDEEIDKGVGILERALNAVFREKGAVVRGTGGQQEMGGK